MKLIHTFICFYFLSTSLSFCEGLTVITHGFGSNVEKWVRGMRNAISTRVDMFSVYEVIVDDDLNITISSRVGNHPVESTTGEIVILLCWNAESGFRTSNKNIAEVFTPKLFQSDFIGEIGRPLVEFPIHLIGHSRGGSLVVEIARLLGVRGVWVDHVTTLDPHPLTGILGDDAPIAVFDNVVFAENYYQTLDNPKGQFAVNAYNRKLVTLAGGYSRSLTHPFDSNHSDVHLWYFGTIDTSASADNNDNKIITEKMRQDWWEPSEDRGANTGFYFSRIAGGTRPSQGIHLRHDGIAGRASIDRNGDQWPNVILTNNTPGSTWDVTPGVSLPIIYRYQDADSSVNIEFGLDMDRNPYNDSPIKTITAVTKSRNIDGPSQAFIQWVPTADDNGKYVFAKVNDEQTRTRYFYVNKKVNVGQFPDLYVAKFDVLQSQGKPGDTLEAEYEIVNGGDLASGVFAVQWYLSRDSTITTSDKVLDRAGFSRPGNSTTDTLPKSLRLPDLGDPIWSGSGTYYVGMIVDVDNAVQESNESNNRNRGLGLDLDSTEIIIDDNGLINVPGTSDLWLAGMPDGATASGGDRAPQQSPVEVMFIEILVGSNLKVSATGQTANGSNSSLDGPDGEAGNQRQSHESENGISGVISPIDSLIGVFLSEERPNSRPAPEMLNFGELSSRDYLRITPKIKQTFFIGDGLTSDGTEQLIIVPEGATRLFLGTMDGCCWGDNIGEFHVSIVAEVPPMVAIRMDNDKIVVEYTGVLQVTDSLDRPFVDVRDVSSPLILERNNLLSGMRFLRTREN